jgi:hypothetical protein
MRVIIAYAEMDGGARPDAAHADALAAQAHAAGHDVEHLVMPDNRAASPQARALPWQLLPCGAYGDELWALNFPACALRHPNRRVWFTRAAPFDGDTRAPQAALRALIDADQGSTVVFVEDAALARELGLEDCAQVAVPTSPARPADPVERDQSAVVVKA